MPRIAIVTPAVPRMRNGNWSTAERWRRYLESEFDVSITQGWDGERCDLLIALHARKSAESIMRFSKTGKPLVVVLTGTDIYRDIHLFKSTSTSLNIATALIALQSKALDELTEEQRCKCHVVEQSATAMAPLEPRAETFDLLLVGHMRKEKDPLTAMRAMSLLADPNLRLRHIGRADEPDIGPKARSLADADSRIELLGEMSQEATRETIRRGRVLLLPSTLEGGANVLIEAVMSSVPVLASRIPGSVGLLGEDYGGYFSCGNDAQLAELIRKCSREPAWLTALTAQGRKRSHLFEPNREKRLLIELMRDLLTSS